mmetsp:Transcript_5227/g.4413  ORF Transcript_5227/g.4413 Transcript_5227/m.4413 type:complete len:232 (+) Transcript_5227:174-869(+)
MSIINLSVYEDSDTNGAELRTTLAEESENIVIIVWFNNLFDHWSQNRLNQETRGTIMSILKTHHPKVIYHEADLSTYSAFAYTYAELAEELGINTDDLNYGPTVVVMHDQRGSAIRSEKGSLALVTAVDKEIHSYEKDIYGVNTQLCDIDQEIEALNHFKMHAPWENYEYFKPTTDDSGLERNREKTVAAKMINMNKYNDKLDKVVEVEPSLPPKFQLQEPDKAFTRRRRR